MSGIPANTGAERAPDNYGGDMADPDVDHGANPLAALANNPGFEQIRQRIISDPAFYQQFMT